MTTTDIQPTQLTPAEQTRLGELEGTIRTHLESFIEVGHAFTEIRVSRLYRETHRTFEDYCDEVWGFSRQRAYQLIDAAGVSTVVDIENEAQARELVTLFPSKHGTTRFDEDGAADARDAFDRAKKRAEEKGRRLTADDVRHGKIAVQRKNAKEWNQANGLSTGSKLNANRQTPQTSRRTRTKLHRTLVSAVVALKTVADERDHWFAKMSDADRADAEALVVLTLNHIRALLEQLEGGSVADETAEWLADQRP